MPLARRVMMYQAAAGGGSTEVTFYADASDETLGYASSSTAAYIVAANDYGESELRTAHVYFNIGTTIGAGTITAATISWYNYNYNATGKSTTEIGAIDVYDGDGTTFEEIYYMADGEYVDDTTIEHELTEAELAYLGTGSLNNGSYDTEFRWRVPEPDTSQTRQWDISAFEDFTRQEARLVVTYTPA